MKSQLKRLNQFVGKWKTEGEIMAADSSPASAIEGIDTYEWLPGGYFLIHRVDVRMGGEQIDSIEIIGYDPSTNTYPMNYFGYQGSKGVMHASFDGKIWTFNGDTERFTGSFDDSGNKLTGRWEQLQDSEWVHWMDIRLTKIK